ncbi:MAG: hypothetical protein NWE89_05460 [Candidatus Bathyarchaeota archaeon]|nr:hypothetical protein [Candidatus Bathyarchaeota archaeon]
MKKVTIITPPEYEGPVLESLGRARVTHLTQVTGSEFEGLRGSSGKEVDYKKLYDKIRTQLVEPLGLSDMTVARTTPSVDELKAFALDPESKVDEIIDEAALFVEKIKASREEVHVQNNNLLEELKKKLEAIDEEKTRKWDNQLALLARLESLQALEPEELKSCFAVGIVKNEDISKMSEYLKRYPETYHRASEISKEESLLFVFGSEESEKWVEALFLVFDIKDIFDVLETGDVLLVLDPKRRKEAIEKYKAQLVIMEKEIKVPDDETKEEREIREKLGELEDGYEKKIADLKDEFDKKIKQNEEASRLKIEELQTEQSESIGKIRFYVNILKLSSRKGTLIFRSRVISVLQGYTPEYMIPDLMAAVKEVESEFGEILYVEVSDVGHEDKHAPTPEMNFKSKSLQPLWILTRLRGWPSADEFNPGYISVLIFCFQFGLMFGDIGQGVVFLLIGLLFHKKYDRGMMKYLTALFIPMGIAAIVFGFMYDSIFLYEHEISHWLHGAHIELPFRYPIMPNPTTETGKLMNLIFLVGAVEIVFGSLLGAYNSFRAKNYAGIIGERGLGMGFYVTGLYLSASTMFTTGLDVMILVAAWPFKLMLLGMGLSFIEPIVHSLMHGHGIGGIESIGQGIGGLLMTFVEGLANMFSFLRIAAFAIAHVSLSGAGVAMGAAIGSPIGGMIMMNIIALSFEFVSSSVQSLRLLYYEFMGKFFQGEGIRFKPLIIRDSQPIVE